jgi:hypothetical protein
MKVHAKWFFGGTWASLIGTSPQKHSQYGHSQIKSLCSLSLSSSYIGKFFSKGHGIKCGVIGNNLGNILGASKDIVNEGSSFEHVNQVGRTYTFGIEYF